MLENKKRMDEINPAYHYMGKENGNNVFLVDIKENKNKKREIRLDDGLLDVDEFPDDFCNFEWKEETQKDENNLTQNDFYRMEYKEQQYFIYR